jgi:hypothetical protein
MLRLSIWSAAIWLLLAGCEGEHRPYDASLLAQSPAGAASGGSTAASGAAASDDSAATSGGAATDGSAATNQASGAPEEMPGPIALDPSAPPGPPATPPNNDPQQQLSAGSPCSSGAVCASGNCQATSTGDEVCCLQRCGEQGLNCSADGSRCVECEGDAPQCQGNSSRTCAGNTFASQPCGNGCDAATGRCNPARPTGSLCDEAAQCQSGDCALDVTSTRRCCDPTCAAAERLCGADGSCVCPADRDDVAGSCRLRLGATCSQTGDCASGFCAGKVSGGSICCAQGCNGAFCSTDGSDCIECEGAASTCQGNTASRCENGTLIRTQCANGCNAATGVCNGLRPSGQACTTSGQCASNLCASDLNGAQRCCTPNCAATGRVCGTDGACVCANPNDVFTGSGCGCAQGTKSCGDGRCIANNQCCETCTGGRSCQAGNCTCPNGQQFINGQCRLNLGAACSATGTPCVSGLCVDGVCCDSACNGVCMQCQAGSGRCVMPADDPACPARITCPTPANACQQAVDITSNRCQSLGACKTAANCGSPAPAPARTACDEGEDIGVCGDSSCLLFRVCNGGTCASPTVQCAGQQRAVSADGCCFVPIAGSTAPESFSTSFCNPTGAGAMTVTCDGQDDCPVGQVCCANDSGNFNSIACRGTCTESGVQNPVTFDSAGTYRVCQSPGGGTSQCPGGRPCNRRHPDLPGWAFCRFP